MKNSTGGCARHSLGEAGENSLGEKRAFASIRIRIRSNYLEQARSDTHSSKRARHARHERRQRVAPNDQISYELIIGDHTEPATALRGGALGGRPDTIPPRVIINHSRPKDSTKQNPKLAPG